MVEQQFAWPSNPWPKGEKQKELGRTTLKDSLDGLSGVSIAILTRAFGMTAAEVEDYLVDVRKDMKNSELAVLGMQMIPLGQLLTRHRVDSFLLSDVSSFRIYLIDKTLI